MRKKSEKWEKTFIRQKLEEENHFLSCWWATYPNVRSYNHLYLINMPALMLHLIHSSQPREYSRSNTQTPNPLYLGHWAKASQALSLIQTDTQTLLRQDFSRAESLCLLQKHVYVRFPRQRVVLVHLWRKANTRDGHSTKHKDKARTLKDRTGQKQVGLRIEHK